MREIRGEVLHYDETVGFGFITGSDGTRYTFSRNDLGVEGAIAKGISVLFVAQGDHARSVRREGASAPALSPNQFGRGGSARAVPQSTGLWGYFVRTVTVGYADFRGRARRKEYWAFILFWTISMVLLAVGGAVVEEALGGGFDPDEPVPALSALLCGVFFLATVIPSISVMVRRQHDIGLSGWFFFLVLIPTIGGLILFVFTLIPSQKHENKWGPVPNGVPVAPPFTPQVP